MMLKLWNVNTTEVASVRAVTYSNGYDIRKAQVHHGGTEKKSGRKTKATARRILAETARSISLHRHANP